MEAMGKKDAARDIAVAAGVPVVPSYDLDADPAGFAYPVLVKAAAGGGGKGMRIVRSAGEYDAALAAARREALGAFGDDTILIEKYVEHGRHIEVQVLADHHGNVVHLFERDCSTQRRHQKVLEEAPAPTITDAQRELVTGSAVALCREVGYTNAGTVEFLLDSDSGEVYFLEMNTRLQVEHPVTEEVVRVRGMRIDLVELQLRVAAGEPLRLRPGRRHRRGPRDRGADLRRGLLRRVPAPGRHRRAGPLARGAVRRPGDRRRGPGSASTPPSSPARWSAPASTRCWARSSRGARTARPPAPRWSTPSTTPASSGSPPTPASCAPWPPGRSSATPPSTRRGSTTPRSTAPDQEVALVTAAWVDAVLHSPRFTEAPGDPFATDGWRVAGPHARTLVALETGDGRRELRVDVPGHLVDDVVVREHRLADHTAVLSLDDHRRPPTSTRPRTRSRSPSTASATPSPGPTRSPTTVRPSGDGTLRRPDARHGPRRPRRGRPAGGGG